MEGNDADIFSSGDARGRHRKRQDRDEVKAAAAEEQADHRHGQVELHLYAERPEMLPALQKRDRREICDEEEVPNDRREIVAAPQQKDRHCCPRKRHDPCQALHDEKPERSARRQELNDQNPDKVKNNAMPWRRLYC